MTACTVLYTDDVQLSTDMCSFQLASTNSNSCTVVTVYNLSRNCLQLYTLHGNTRQLEL